MHIHRPEGVGLLQHVVEVVAVTLLGEEVVERAVVDDEGAFTGLDPDTSHGGLAAAGSTPPALRIGTLDGVVRNHGGGGLRGFFHDRGLHRGSFGCGSRLGSGLGCFGVGGSLVGH